MTAHTVSGLAARVAALESRLARFEIAVVDLEAKAMIGEPAAVLPLPSEPRDGSIVMVLDDEGRRDSMWSCDDTLDDCVDGHCWLNETTGVHGRWLDVCGSGRVVILYEPGVDRVAIPDGMDSIAALGRACGVMDLTQLAAVIDELREGTWRAEP